MIDNPYYDEGCPMMNGYYPRAMAPFQYSPFNEMYDDTYPGANMRQIQQPTSTGEADFEFEPGPPVTQSIEYTQGFLMTQIGKYVSIDFLIGTNMFIDREGILEEVGISYVVLREASGNLVMCDIYSIKFVEIFENGGPRPR